MAVMSKGFCRWVKPVQAAVCGGEPEIAATVAGDAPNRIAAETVRIVGVVKVSGTTFGCGFESVYAGIYSKPQITMIVFHQIPNKVGAQASGIVGIVFVYDKRVAIVAIEAISGAEPLEAPVVLQNGNHVALG